MKKVFVFTIALLISVVFMSGGFAQEATPPPAAPESVAVPEKAATEQKVKKTKKAKKPKKAKKSKKSKKTKKATKAKKAPKPAVENAAGPEDK